jgi:hypothetical protein
MNRIELVTELLKDCPADTLERHTRIADAIRADKPIAEVLELCGDELPETYAWLKAEWPRCTLAADTVSGVYNSEIPTDADVLWDKDFYDMLSTVEEGEVLYGDVSEEWAEKIAAEYGIR